MSFFYKNNFIKTRGWILAKLRINWGWAYHINLKNTKLILKSSLDKSKYKMIDIYL